MQQVGSKPIENAKPLEEQSNCGYLSKLWNGHQSSRRAVLATTLIVITTVFTLKAYMHYQNGKIENIDCHFGANVDGAIRNFNYYQNEYLV